MKAHFTTILILASVLAFPGETALAADSTPILELGPGYVHEDGRLALEDIWEFTLDVPAHAYGFVESFLGPMADLDTSDPEVEYTWVLQDMVSAMGSWAESEQGSCGGRSLDFKSGRFRVLRDKSRDAGVADPATFADGEVLLEADLVQTSTNPYNPFMLFLGGCEGEEVRWAYLQLSFVGGTRFSDISSGGEDLFATGEGAFRIGGELPWSSQLLDYFADLTATVSIWDTVPTRETTWGRIKALYK